MTIELQYEVTRKEFIDFYLSHYKKTPLYVGWYITIDLIAIFYFLIFVVTTYNNYTRIGLFVLFLIFTSTPFVVSRIYKNNILKLYSLKIFDNCFLHTSLKINEDGIELITNLCKVFFKWNTLTNLYFINNNIYITTYMREFIFIGSNSIKEDIRKNFLDMVIKNTDLKISSKVPDIIFS
ncbi:hypothetical protein GC105_08335 [Alkalibaculum sp. M08DMB]|uniref:YcxB-like protein domain-containing protein n=1 Tax=Alkalibaculum sporogenes TaxID=2655001 RepID=A0A6A7K8R7_9FIRM|nr:hypothetical protein [Alkalibaculum sporogenes]MPW25796.1 hypothetical protein [Alkalibaculum sporogenes]